MQSGLTPPGASAGPRRTPTRQISTQPESETRIDRKPYGEWLFDGNSPPVRFKCPSTEGPTVAMPKVEITVPEHLDMQIAQLVERGEFLNREEAIEDLLSTGMKAYKTSGPVEDEEEPGFEDDGMMGHDDEYVF
jgi:hypothetical protein